MNKFHRPALALRLMPPDETEQEALPEVPEPAPYVERMDRLERWQDRRLQAYTLDSYDRCPRSQWDS